MGMWREMMKSVDVPNTSANDIGDRRRGREGRLVELLRQAGAWQVLNARRRGDGPWTLNRSVLLAFSFSCPSVFLLHGK